MNKKIKILISIIFLLVLNFNLSAYAMDDISYPGVIVPYYPKDDQWGLGRINIEDAWDIEQGSDDVLIAVIDSGISIETSDLSTRVDISLSRSFLDIDEEFEGLDGMNEFDSTYNDPTYDSIGHGTHVAGIIGANGINTYGISGVCTNIKLVSLKAIKSNGDFDQEDLEEAIEYATEIGADIINFSGGGPTSSQGVLNAIRDFPGLFVCCAGNVGNNNDDVPFYPAEYDLDNIIVVASTDSNDERSTKSYNGIYSSNYGKNSVDIFAPGSNILSIYPSNVCEDYEIDNPSYEQQVSIQLHDSLHYSDNLHYDYGTSQATPFVSGVAGLILSKNESLNTLSVKNIILKNVDKINSLRNLCVSAGRLNAYKALNSFNHAHNVSMQYYDNIRHINTCSCGYVEGEFGNHAISAAQVNMKLAICLGCNRLLNMEVDIANVVLSNKKIITSNGSYMLNNGIIVIVPEDLDNYVNGTINYLDNTI